MRHLLLLFVTSLAACGTADSEPIVITFEDTTQTTGPTTVETPLTGEELYHLNCETCHGPAGQGGATWSGAIRGLEIHDIVKNGRSAMVAVPISDDDIGLVQEYLDSFGVDQSALSGREIFQNRCAPCHGDTGEGTVLSFPIRFMHPDFGSWIVRNGRDTRDFAGPMPQYSADEISDAQLTEIIDFLWAQPWPAGGAGLYKAFCANCHGETGSGGYAGHRAAREFNSVSMVRNGHGGSNYGARTSYMPRWTADQISDTELSTLDTYVRQL